MSCIYSNLIHWAFTLCSFLVPTNPIVSAAQWSRTWDHCVLHQHSYPLSHFIIKRVPENPDNWDNWVCGNQEATECKSSMYQIWLYMAWAAPESAKSKKLALDSYWRRSVKIEIYVVFWVLTNPFVDEMAQWIRPLVQYATIPGSRPLGSRDNWVHGNQEATERKSSMYQVWMNIYIYFKCKQPLKFYINKSLLLS